ncbi:MAG: hypothetical protein JWR80_8009 [Bradyrhizobium sp.]|nr:hypothetical protein [Bradyrhizobium sp.]
MTQVIVKLSRSYTVHNETFDSVSFREPTYKDIYMDGLGMPEELQPTGNGGAMVVTYYSVIAEYVTRLAVKPTAECLHELSATDAKKIERTISGFFRDTPAPTTSPTGSSSGSDSTVDA